MSDKTFLILLLCLAAGLFLTIGLICWWWYDFVMSSDLPELAKWLLLK